MRPSAIAVTLFAGLACIPTDPDLLGADAATNGSGGAIPRADGGIAAGGGNGGSGGGTASGGQIGSGGVTDSGGHTGSGGEQATGGSSGTGGTAGRGTAGGTAGRGAAGSSGAGGGAGRGVAGSGPGGRGGMGGGGAASGGSAPTSCNLPNHGGTGSFTYYYFGQGTARDFSGTGYRTACGYYGTQSGSSSSGPNDTVANIPGTAPASPKYFAAIPGQNGFDTKANCGACVQITGQTGKSVIATVVDECPYGNDGGNAVCGNNASGHLDLSTAAFDAIGPFTNSQGATIGNPTNTTWKFVPCPVAGNVVLQIKNGNDNEFFIQNTILAVKSVSRGSENAIHQSYGAWHFGTKLNAGETLTLTDTLNRTLAIQIGNTTMNQNQDTGRQFPACQ